jgi:hypothetical protein
MNQLHSKVQLAQRLVKLRKFDIDSKDGYRYFHCCNLRDSIESGMFSFCNHWAKAHDRNNVSQSRRTLQSTKFCGSPNIVALNSMLAIFLIQSSYAFSASVIIRPQAHAVAQKTTTRRGLVGMGGDIKCSSTFAALRMSNKNDENDDESCYDDVIDDVYHHNNLSVIHSDDALAKVNADLEAKLGIQLQYASIDVQGLFLPFKRDSPHQLLSLDRFRCLHVPPTEDEQFFPENDNLYMRESMKRLMKRFTFDRTTMKKKAPLAQDFVLFGSPGTGKSLLFFLAAVWKASKGMQPIIYLRITTSEKISIFYMFPDGPNKIGIYFKRLGNADYIKNFALSDNLQQLVPPIALALGAQKLLQPELLWFIDGPKHDDTANILKKVNHYLCTSGGHPGPKNEQLDTLCLWALDAWSGTEMVECLQLLYNITEDDAQGIYDYCGGCIGDAVQAVKDNNTDKVKNFLLKSLNSLRLKGEKIQLFSHAMDNEKEEYKRLHMIFVKDNNTEQMTDFMNILHIVDSKFVLRCLI